MERTNSRVGVEVKGALVKMGAHEISEQKGILKIATASPKIRKT